MTEHKSRRRGRPTARQAEVDELVRSRIDQLIRDSKIDDYASISTLLGKNHAYIQQYIKRRTPRSLKEEDRRLIARHFGVPADVLFADGTGCPTSPAKEMAPDAFPTEEALDTMVEIPIIPNPDSGYDGAEQSSGGTGKARALFMGFSARYLSGLASNWTVESLILTSVRGEAMSPTLNDGDLMLILSDRTQRLRDGIVAIRQDDLVQAKRVMVHPAGKRVTLTNDNALYGAGIECSTESLNILGRIIWCGRQLS